MSITDEIRQRLFAEHDDGYRIFNSGLIPTVPADKVLGVRMPAVRIIAKDLVNRCDTAEFLGALPHLYHEENLLHALIIGYTADADELVDRLEHFLPYVDNWAVCDSIRPILFKQNSVRLEEWLIKKLDSVHTYTVRFAIEMLMLHFLKTGFKEDVMEKISGISGDDYYLNMMVAWYFSTALAERYHHAIVYLEEKRLSPWIHNKTISKACDSHRLSGEKKTYLKTLKIH